VLTIARLQLDALFRHDERGRLTAINTPEYRPVPRFFMARTSKGNLWRPRHDLPESLVRELEAVCLREPQAADLRREAETAEEIRALLSPIESESRGPAYAFASIPDLPRRARVFRREDVPLLARYYPDDTFPEEGGPTAVVVEDGAVVSFCFCARLTSEAAEAGVETVEAYRRRGYALEVAALWARAVFQTGRQPLYSTSWDNVASQAVANKFSLGIYAEDWSVF
jgi:RimJ/RimL family protein N-acetyltransferase